MAKSRKRKLIATGLVVLVLLALPSWVLTSWVIDFKSDKPRLRSEEFAAIAQKAAQPIERVEFASSDGVKVAAWYLPAATGTGSAKYGVVMTHGGGDDKTYYLPLAEQLRATGYDVMLPDLRGHGESAESPSGNTLGIAESRDVAAAAHWLSTRKGTGHVAALGVSMGGVAAMLASRQETHIDALVLESTSYNARRVFEFALQQVGMRPAALRSGYAGLLTRLLLWRVDAPWEAIGGARLPNFDEARLLRPVPVLIVYGDRDPLVKAEDIQNYAAQFARKPEIAEFPNTGHGVYPKNRDAYRDRLLAFLAAWRQSPPASQQQP